MSERLPDGTVIIVDEDEQECELCHKVEETRPYGPNGEEICFDCGMLNVETTTRKMNAYLFGDKEEDVTDAAIQHALESAARILNERET